MPHLGHGSGPIPARIMLVGEAWGENEERAQTPFVGVSGQELNRMLQEAGILRSDCYTTNLVNARPPGNDISAWIAMKKKDITAQHVTLRDKFVLPIIQQGYTRLLAEIELVQPNIIVAFGNAALWALTGHWGVTKWRGSQLKLSDTGPKVIPTIHPAAILREWSFRPAAVTDLRRVKRNSFSREYNASQWSFTIRPSFVDVMVCLGSFIDALNTPANGGVTQWDCWLDFDLETKHGHIDCAGLSWSRTHALCIPFMDATKPEGYWSEDEEAAIVHRLYQVLCHPDARIRGQNLLYDCQYTMRHWHFIPRVAQDTMISHHTAFAGMRKALDFQASLYCENYCQWKPDKQAWKEGG